MTLPVETNLRDAVKHAVVAKAIESATRAMAQSEGVYGRAGISFLRIGKVLIILGLCRSSLYNRIADGLFVSSINLGGRAVGFPSHEVDAIAASLLAGKSEDDIRALVRKLEADRKNAAQVLEAA